MRVVVENDSATVVETWNIFPLGGLIKDQRISPEEKKTEQKRLPLLEIIPVQVDKIQRIMLERPIDSPGTL